jgi:hypothetical protein
MSVGTGPFLRRRSFAQERAYFPPFEPKLDQHRSGIRARSYRGRKAPGLMHVRHGDPALFHVRYGPWITIQTPFLPPFEPPERLDAIGVVSSQALQPRGIRRPKRHFGTEVAAHGERRLAKRTQKRPSHPLAVGKTRLPRDLFDRVTPLLDQEPCGFDAKLLDRLCGGLTGFGHERSRELTRAEVRGLRKVLDAEALVEILSRERERDLDAIRLRLHFEQGRKLRLPPGATMMKDELPADRARYFDSDVVFHQSQHQVYGGGHSSRSPNAAVFGEDAILLDVDPWEIASAACWHAANA